MKEKDKNNNEEIDLLDVLLDEDNEDPITLYDENDKPVKFDQVAIIPLDDDLYAILKPIDDIPGVADDEAIVFAVKETEDGQTVIQVEEDEPTAMRVFDQYYVLLDKEEKKNKKN